MENIYRLSERAYRASMEYEEVMAALDARYEENGGEVTSETEAMEAEAARLSAVQEQIMEDFCRFPDEYAAWYKNVEAQKKVLEAEKKAVEEEQKKVLQLHQARINRQEATMEWIKLNMEAAMNIAHVDRFDKKKTGGLFSIYFSKSRSLNVDESLALNDYRGRIEALQAQLPDWLTLQPKISKSVAGKADVLPAGFESVESKNLVIR
ncbi:MAG: hypothetical protein NC115_12035 [Bacteroidales bacterium]|nr:hypothetical protein [Bacteroidales bacterium]